MPLNMSFPQYFFHLLKKKYFYSFSLIYIPHIHFCIHPLNIFKWQMVSENSMMYSKINFWRINQIIKKAKQIKYWTYIQLLHASGKIAHKNKHVVVLIFISPTVHTPNTINKYLSKVSRGLTLRIRSDHRIKRSAVNLLLSPNPYREDDLSTGLLDLGRQTWRKLIAKSAVTIGEQR